MALVTCPDCAHEISDAAPSCPWCGRPVPVVPVPAPAAQPSQPEDVPEFRPSASRNLTIAGVVAVVVVAGASFYALKQHVDDVQRREKQDHERLLDEARAATEQLRKLNEERTPTCDGSQFELSNLTMDRSSGYLTLRGVIRHSCSMALGPQMKWTAYNKDGTVGFTTDFWPAGTVNIQPLTDYPFETVHQASPQIVDRLDVTLVGAHLW
jgi:hypothetical protein